jgi:hypothetical protein
VVNGNMTLPTGWTLVVIEKGTGVVHNPKTQHHLCPKCLDGFQRAMREDVQSSELKALKP